MSSAAHTPTTPVTRAWTARYGVIWIGFWMANLVPIQLLLPNQLAAIDPDGKVLAFAVVNAIAGVVALIALPVCGALSDRSRSRFGRRRFWIGGGAVLFAAGLLITGMQTSVAGLSLWWAFSQIGLAAMTSGLTAVIADTVPERQRGLIAGAIFGPQALGVVLGILIVAVFSLSDVQGYVVLAVALLGLSVPFLWKYVEAPAVGGGALRLGAIVRSLAVDVRGNPDFAWAFSGRLLVNLGNSLGTCYLLYFLTDALRVPDPEFALLLMTLMYLVAGLVATFVGGWLSDRTGKRRVFVLWTALMQAAAGGLLAAFPSFEVALVAAALMGGGFGAYMSVDQALVTQVLPDASSRAKDLGILNIGAIVPPALAPLIAGLMITSGGQGYPVLFTAVAVVAGLGAVMVYRVKSVP